MVPRPEPRQALARPRNERNRMPSDRSALSRLRAWRPQSETKLIGAFILILAVCIALFTALSSRSGRVFAKALTRLGSARTLRFRMTTYRARRIPETITVTFVKPARLRRTAAGRVTIQDLQRGESLTLLPEEKKAQLRPIETGPIESDPAVLIRELLRLSAGQECGLSDRRFGRATAIGFSVPLRERTWAIWTDPTSAEPVQIELTVRKRDRPLVVLDELKFNPAVDESLMVLDPPEGYALERATPAPADPRVRQ